MTQEEKKLLIKDLSSRLPHKVKASYYGTDEEMECTDIIEGIIIENNDVEIIIGQYGLPIEKVKPYLFPLSSMTEEQKEELDDLHWSLDTVGIHNFIDSFTGPYREFVSHSDCIELIDWLNKNHFDYRGLISMGLALNATELGIY